MRDLIDAVQLYEYVNLANVEAKGIEVSLDARPTQGTHGYLNYTFQHARLSGSPMTNSPSHMVKAGLGADLFRVTTAAVELRYESSRITPQGTTTDGFVIANSNFTVRPFAYHSRCNTMLGGLELGLHADNLFNLRYANPGSIEHLEPSIEQNGRTFVLRLTSPF